MSRKSNGLPSQDVLLDLYRRMVLIRKIEEKIAALYPQQEMRCPTHLSIGQEAVSAGVCAAMRPEDTVFLNHRCHAAYIAKGGDINKLMAELYGKKTGCAKGRGGSMHLVDPEAGVLGVSALLAGTIPIACGAALGYQRQGTGQAAACFFGDAAVEEGTFHESVNLAVVWKLPLLFICENNLYSTCTPLSKRQPAAPIHERVRACGMRTYAIDGNDAVRVYEIALEALDRARRGAGPSFIECATYRWLEHVGPNFDWELGYRTKEEVESWMKRCPILSFEKRLSAMKLLQDGQRSSLLKEIDKRVAEAVRFAKASPFPEPDELMLGISDA